MTAEWVNHRGGSGVITTATAAAGATQQPGEGEGVTLDWAPIDSIPNRWHAGCNEFADHYSAAKNVTDLSADGHAVMEGHPER
jgi:hypothetical protein